jgi:hypothetical protein
MSLYQRDCISTPVVCSLSLALTCSLFSSCSRKPTETDAAATKTENHISVGAPTKGRLATTVTSRKFVTSEGKEVDPTAGVPVGTEFAIRVRFRLPEGTGDKPRPVVAAINFVKPTGSVLMQSAVGSPKSIEGGDYEVEVPLKAFDRPGSYQIEVGNEDVDLGRSPLVISGRLTS